MNWLNKLIFKVVSEWIQSAIDLFGELINNIFVKMYEINKALNFTEINNYLIAFALSCLGLFAIKQGLQVYVFNTDGDADQDPLEMITRVSIATAIIVSGSFIIEKLIEIAAALSEDVMSKSINPEKNFTVIAGNILQTLNSSSNVTGAQPLIIAIMLIGIIIAFILFIFQAAKRGAELILFQLLLPLMAIDLLTTSKERWNSFFTELMLCIFGYILQMFSFKIFLQIFNSFVADATKTFNLLAAFAWLVVILSTPKWLQKFAYNSGVGGGVKGGARTAAFIVPSLIKK